jgi:type II secretory pathway pseudopilin PulG
MIRRCWALCRARLAHLEQGEAAFTLLETILSMAITSLVLGTVVVTLYQFNTLTRRQSDVMLMSQQMSNLATVLSRDVISAREGQVSEDGSVLTLQVVDYPSDGDGNPTFAPVTTTITYTFTDASGELWRAKDDEPMRRVARYVEDVDLGPSDVPLPVTVQVTITTSVGEESLPTVLRYERRAVD